MPKNKEDWDTVKGIAASGADKKLEHYVLEIQRLAVDLPLIRKFEPKDSKGLPSSQQTGVKGAKPGDILVLRVVKAHSHRSSCSLNSTRLANLPVCRNKPRKAVPSLLLLLQQRTR